MLFPWDISILHHNQFGLSGARHPSFLWLPVQSRVEGQPTFPVSCASLTPVILCLHFTSNIADISRVFVSLESLLAKSLSQVATFVKCHFGLSLRDKEEAYLYVLLCCGWLCTRAHLHTLSKRCAGMFL